MTSIEAARSSSTNVAMRSPRLVYLRCNAVTTPRDRAHRAVVELVRDRRSSTRRAGAARARRPSAGGRSRRGRACPSRRAAVRPCRTRRRGSRGGRRTRASRRSSPPPRSKRLIVPASRSRRRRSAASTIASNTFSRPLRGWPSESKPPPLISDSIVRLLSTLGSTRSQKSWKSANGPPALALFDQLRRHTLADVAHRGEPEADRVAFAREVAERRVHVGDEHRDVELAALAEVHRGLVEVRLDAREQRGEVRDRMVRLQPRGLVRDEAVADAVRLVERVVGERLDGREVALRELLGVTVAHAALDELRALLRDELADLLAGRLAQVVGFFERVARRASATPASAALGRSSARTWGRGSPRGRGGRR